MKKCMAVVALAWAGFGSNALAQTYLETESNDSRATANGIASMASGESFGGSSTSGSGAGLDYWRVRTAAAPLGIYRHTLSLNNTIFTAGIRALSVNAAPADTLAGIPWDGVVGTATASEVAGQASAIISGTEVNSWYGFGKNESVMYRINGSLLTPNPYRVTLTSTLVTPLDIGVYEQGQISISTFNQGHSNDTDMWIYDSNFNAMIGYGNDDESPLGGSPGTGGSVQSFLSRSYAPGTYYLALTNYNMLNNQASPSDDDFRTGAVLEFADALLNTSTTGNVNLTFTIADGAGTSLQVANSKVGGFDVNWFKFTVVPAPSALGLLGLGGLVAGRRRR